MTRLQGELRVPGDKSISHRALMLGALAEGTTVIERLADGEDVRSTWRCLREMGVKISSRVGQVGVEGLGWRGLREPKRELDCGNSGTTMRLLAGLIAGHDFPARLLGDDSLLRRPMQRVAEPLRQMGATIELSRAGTAPMGVRGAALRGIDYASPLPSAQVKSAVLLAGLLATGETSVSEPAQSRDHTERLLARFGVVPRRDGLKVSVTGGLHLARGTRVSVPGDFSSAAFWIAAATLLPGSELRLSAVGLNPTRTGLLDALLSMGADIRRENEAGGGSWEEPVGDLIVRSASLRAVDLPASEVPRLIDELPVLALLASQARGTSRLRGLSELRHKESDRLRLIAELFNGLGGRAEIIGDDLVIEGPAELRPGKVRTARDHRIAMTAAVAGLLYPGVEPEETASVAVSYPHFFHDLKRLAR